MISGERIGLRARHEEDIPILQTELYDDVPTQARADSRPWRPLPPGSKRSPYAVDADAQDIVYFSITLLDGGHLVGEALLWAIDSYNRRAHLGVSVLPGFRGQGLGVDVVRTLCEYGFAVLGLHRLQIETIPGNTAMINAAVKAGFTEEGRLRRSTWTYGTFEDEVVFALLAEEWAARPR